MKTLTHLLLAFLLTSLVAEAQFRPGSRKATGVRAMFEHDGTQRFYRLHVPTNKSDAARPLVVVLHGGGGNAELASGMGFTPLADRENFIALYPEGTGKHWNDGRTGKVIAESTKGNDDVGFIAALIEKVRKDHEVDSQRIFVTGFSNGGTMSHRLGIEKADLFAAIAPGIGGVAKPLGTTKKFKPSEPVSVLIIQGTEDPMVPYDGGKLTVRLLPGLKNTKGRDHGSIISTDKTVELWKMANGILGEPKVTKLPDNDKLDGCTLEKTEWPAGRSGTEVTLIRMVGGGHTVPGMRQYLPVKILGKTCQDADAPELIWKFFKKHSKKE